MGPLATARQLADVRAGVERLARAAAFVTGDGGRGDLVGVEGDRGFFMAPVLLAAERADVADVHAFEVFGPVATILPYSGMPLDAIAAGGGGLVSSVYTDDLDVAREFVLGAERFEAPIIKDQQLDAAEGAHQPGIAAVAAGQREVGKQLWDAVIEHRAVVAARLVAEGTGKGLRGPLSHNTR